MFREAAAIGGLDVQLVYFRGLAECRASPWVAEAIRLAGLMEKIDCRGGHTQIGKIIAHARRETEKTKVQALVFVGDAMEEKLDDLCHAAGELGLLGVPTFMFQEGYDAVAEQAFREIARLTRGAYCRFDPGAAQQLRRASACGCGVRRRWHARAGRPVGASRRRRDQAHRADEVAMGAILFGAVVLGLVLIAMNTFANANPRKLVPVIKTVGGVGALAGAVFLAVRGQIGIAVPLGVAGLSLLGWLPFGQAGFFQRTQKSPGQVSRVRSAFVEMELDHDTGVMRGRVLAGTYEGQDLDALACRS